MPLTEGGFRKEHEILLLKSTGRLRNQKNTKKKSVHSSLIIGRTFDCVIMSSYKALGNENPRTSHCSQAKALVTRQKTDLLTAKTSAVT